MFSLRRHLLPRTSAQTNDTFSLTRIGKLGAETWAGRALALVSVIGWTNNSFCPTTVVLWYYSKNMRKLVIVTSIRPSASCVPNITVTGKFWFIHSLRRLQLGASFCSEYVGLYMYLRPKCLSHCASLPVKKAAPCVGPRKCVERDYTTTLDIQHNWDILQLGLTRGGGRSQKLRRHGGYRPLDWCNRVGHSNGGAGPRRAEGGCVRGSPLPQRGSEGVTPGKILKLQMQNTAFWCISALSPWCTPMDGIHALFDYLGVRRELPRKIGASLMGEFVHCQRDKSNWIAEKMVLSWDSKITGND